MNETELLGNAWLWAGADTLFRPVHRNKPKPDIAEKCEDPFDWEGIHSPEGKLAAAIVLQAVEDWQEAQGVLKLRPHHRRSRKTVKETEEFFLSDYFKMLMGFPGEELLNRLKEEQQT